MIPYSKVESLAACRMTAQQIADVLDVDLNRLKENREAMTDFMRPSVRAERKVKPSYERHCLSLPEKGMPFALRELLRVDKNQD